VHDEIIACFFKRRGAGRRFAASNTAAPREEVLEDVDFLFCCSMWFVKISVEVH
jgi:hypothetical protein